MRVRLSAHGVVQGVGFRPSVYRIARELSLSGWVKNCRGSVEIEAQGERAAELAERIRSLPAPVSLERLDSEEIPERDESGFEIRDSDDQASAAPALPADLATCPECLHELAVPSERRYRYPFTNCTRCGPRYSIVESLPYDRARTSMKGFEPCAQCRAEYDDVADRRFHAEPVACPRCGPTLEFLDKKGTRLDVREAALRRASEVVLGGGVLALRGLGGFQLLCDATNPRAVASLRARKRREEKPFAVLFPDLESVRANAELGPAEAELLGGSQAPIVLLRRDPASSLAGGVAPQNPRVGALLPYTPLHHLLAMAVARPMVCTSGNLSEEPMCTEVAEALLRLDGIADGFLVHDRPIVRPVDDSVARVGPRGVELLRRARGFAPLPVAVAKSTKCVLALGAHMKSTVTLVKAGRALTSQHLGDLDSELGVSLLERTARDLMSFFDARPDVIACDLHPDYASTRLAEELAQGFGVPLVGVQHHHAHVAAAMAEHGLDGPLTGFAWDGTGLGVDGTIWGGETLECRGAELVRRAHLGTFRLPGGDRAAREPRRSALGVVFAVDPARAEALAAKWFADDEAAVLSRMLQTGTNAPWTSSVGRLFDAVSALLGCANHSAFEGQAAMQLELAAERAHAAMPLPPFGLDASGAVDFGPLALALLEARDAEAAALGFHLALVDAIVSLAERSGLADVVLAGGCFQNALLSTRARDALEARGFRVHVPTRVPVNDGSISLGQAHVACVSESPAAS